MNAWNDLSPEDLQRSRSEVASFLADLAAAGLQVSDINDLANVKTVVPESVVSIVIDWLPRWSSEGNAGYTLIAMGHPWAVNVAPLLPPALRAFSRMPDRTFTYEYIASLMNYFGNQYSAELLATLSLDRELGRARDCFIEALARRTKHRDLAMSTVLQLLEDDDVAPSVMRAAARYRMDAAEPVARMRTKDPRSGVRQPARLLLRRLAEDRGEQRPGEGQRQTSREAKPEASKNPIWYRNANWNEAIAAEFDSRLRRKPKVERAQFLRLQGLELTRQEAPELRAIGRTLLEATATDYQAHDAREATWALQNLADALEREGQVTRAEEIIRGILQSRMTSEDVEEPTELRLRLVELMLARGVREDESRDVADLLDAAEADLAPLAFLSDYPFRVARCRARVALIDGDASAARRHAAAALEIAGRAVAEGSTMPSLGAASVSPSILSELWRISSAEGAADR